MKGGLFMPNQLRRLVKIQFITTMLFVGGIYCVFFDLIQVKANTLNALLIIVTLYSLSINKANMKNKTERRLTYAIQSVTYLLILFTLFIIINHMFDWSITLFDSIYNGFGELAPANYIILAFASIANTVARHLVEAKKEEMRRVINLRKEANDRIDEIRADCEKQIHMYEQQNK